jgi:hypothetical protein
VSVSVSELREPLFVKIIKILELLGWSIAILIRVNT